MKLPVLKFRSLSACLNDSNHCAKLLIRLLFYCNRLRLP
ncbi:hypothetical protein EVA_03684 [gut metagenome]|uniref:Uncharacterized protein n=1 Tax=gut metagenome TaxID=749906 RepID=J9GLB3_9ZZZZ